MKMNMDRRNFLKGTAWLGVAALAGGCMTDGFRLCTGGSMQGFACAPLGIEGVDMAKLDFDRGKIDNSSGQMDI